MNGWGYDTLPGRNCFVSSCLRPSAFVVCVFVACDFVASWFVASRSKGCSHACIAFSSIRSVAWLRAGVFAATYAADRSPANMADAANKFLSSLSADERQTASFAFDNVKERERFGFVPTEMHPRVGLTIEKMTEPQRQAAHNLLKAGLSQKGYMTASAIMELESILNLIENPPGSKPGKLERNP